MTLNRIILFATVLTLFFLSCEKDSFTNDPNDVLQFSADTLTIDSVFTTVGSTFKRLKIYNRHSESVLISDIRFANETQTSFKINVDGVSGKTFTNIAIPAQDSLYVFIEVTVDPTNANNPFIFQEPIFFTTNGVKQSVVLRAWAQNAYFHYGEILTSNTIWATDKPHVVVDRTDSANNFFPGLIIPNGVTLTIPAGARVHFTTNAGILCAGTLKAKGTLQDSVLFRGIRLTKEYQHAAGQWLGLLFLRNSKNNELLFTTVDESIFGLWLGFQPETKFGEATDGTRSEISIKNSVIKNSYYWAIRSFNNTIYAENSLFFTCTENLCQLALGGDYEFNHCTFYNGYSKLNKTLLALSNQLIDPNTNAIYRQNLSKANFTNCVWSSEYKETIQVQMSGSMDSNYNFTNCLYRSDSSFTSNRFVNCIINNKPQFVSVSSDREDFQLKATSPCKDAGVRINTILTDLKGNQRLDPKVDIGAYEAP